MKNRILFISIGGMIGLIAGYAYYYFIGCANGTCAITSNPVNSSVYGIFMGGLMGDIIRDWINPKKEEKNKKTF